MAERGTGIFLGDKKVNILQNGDMLVANPFLTEYTIDYLVVAGGGSGGVGNGDRFSGTLGGGGGAGGLLSGSYTVSLNDTISATIGNGGSSDGANGNNSSFIGSGLSTTATAGGGGGNISDGAGHNGGSGGGAAYFGSSAGTGTVGQGFDGNTGRNITNFHTGGSGGGAGSTPPSQTQSGNGSTWLDGTLYAKGGPGALCTGLSTQPGSGGNGGGSAEVRTDGQNGIVKLRYAGNKTRATGGTITQSGGYTYHTFTSNGTFTVTG